MLPVEFKKTPCRPVEFKGQGPLLSHRSMKPNNIHNIDIYEYQGTFLSINMFIGSNFQTPLSVHNVYPCNGTS